MRPVCRLLLLSAALLLLSACASTTHRVTLDPQPEVTPAALGQQRSLHLLVVDQRPRQELGYPRQSSGSDGIVYTEQDVVVVVAAALADGLAAKGFRPEAVAALGRRGIEVEIRSLERNVVDRQIVAEVLLELTAVNASGQADRRYRAQYRARHAERRPVDSATVSERVLNTALDKALTQLLEDEKLLDFIAR